MGFCDFHDSRSVFHGPSLVFHGSRSFVYVFMVPGRFSWVFKVSGWLFMVPGRCFMIPGCFFMVFHGSRLVYIRAVESEFKSNPIFPIFSDYPIFVFTLNCPLPKSLCPSWI